MIKRKTNYLKSSPKWKELQQVWVRTDWLSSIKKEHDKKSVVLGAQKNSMVGNYATRLYACLVFSKAYMSLTSFFVAWEIATL